MRIIGLDVSTSCTGVCVVDPDITPDDSGSHIKLLDSIELSKFKTLWDKADYVSTWLNSIFLGGISRTCAQGGESVKFSGDIRIVLEEPLMGFRPGMSSAQTISTLMRFNGIVSYIARNTFKSEPEYISSSHARKLCGIKLQKTSVAGPQKEQVFSYMSSNDLKHVQWPTKKSGRIVDWSRDACDAYVIARAATIGGVVVVPAKKRSNKK